MGRMKVEEKDTSADVFYTVPAEVADFLPSAEEFSGLVSAMAEAKTAGKPAGWADVASAIAEAGFEPGCGHAGFAGTIALDDVEDEGDLVDALLDLAPGMPCEVAREFASQMMADIEEHRGEATHVHVGTPDDFFDFDSQFADEDDDADFDGFDRPCCFDGEDDMVSACMDLLTAMTMFARGQSLMLEALQHRPEVMELMQGDD